MPHCNTLTLTEGSVDNAKPQVVLDNQRFLYLAGWSGEFLPASRKTTFSKTLKGTQ